MRSDEPGGVPDAANEIAALIRTLHETEQRLEELTSGEAETVADSEGRTFLLRRARKRAEEAFLELTHQTERREKTLNTLLSITDFAYIFDLDGRFLFANQPLLDLWQIPLEAAVGKNFDELNYPPALAERLQREIQEVISTRSVMTGETPFVSAGGDEGYYEYIFTPVMATDGSVEFVAGSTRDVTERTRSANALREGERQQRELVELLKIERSRLVAAQRVAKVGSWETNLNTFAVVWSEETHRIHETDPSTFQPAHEKFLQIVHPEDRQAVNDALTGSLDQRAPCMIEHRLLFPDGRIKFIEERWQVLFDESDKPTVAIGTCQDITERKQDEATLRVQSAALNSAANAIVITDRDFTIVWLNRAFTELTGYSEEEARGRNALDLLKPDGEDPELDRQLMETVTAGRTWQGERFRRRKDGHVYLEGRAVTPVRNGSGPITHYIFMKTELTEQRKMEAQLRQAQKMEAVGQLAAGVAHEFNNLLQALMSMTALVQLRAGSPEVEQIGTEMAVQIKRGAVLTQQLLVFSRLDAVNKTDFDLREQVERGSVLLRRLIPANIHVVVEVPAERLPVDGDFGEIQQVLVNLAINARDAMPSGGTLSLSARAEGNEVLLEVRDTGEGMDEATRGRIFEPFFTTKEVGKGTGLGLAVVYGIVDQHGGRVEVESTPGEGSLFRVILPRGLGAGEQTVAPAPSAQEALATGRILLVEDEEPVRTGISLLLEMLGYEVVAVSSGEEAAVIALEIPPDLLLSDLSLAGMSGSELADRLKTRWPLLKVVLMSGYLEKSLRSESDQRGWHFLQKPFEMVDLAKVLATALLENVPAPETPQRRIGDRK